MGAYHAATLTEKVKGARVTVINDFFAEKAAEVATGIAGARVAEDPFEAINADDVDAVVIATPGAAHEKQVLACLDRGIPVLCEKPLTTDIASAYEIVKRQKDSGKTLIQVGFMRRLRHRVRRAAKADRRRRPRQSLTGALHAPKP